MLLLFVSCGAVPERRVDFVFLITLDTTRADRLGCYGNRSASTPSLDRLAAQGLLFETCIAPVPTTLSSHVSILSSLYPRSHHIPRNGFRVPEDLEMLPKILGAKGFRTAAFIGAYPLHSDFGLHRGFDVYDDDLDESPAGGEVERRADAVTSRAISWLASVQDDPFFLWVHLFDPHWPYDPPEPFDRLGRLPPGRFDTADLDDLMDIRFRRRPYDDGDHAAFLAAYDGELAFLDRRLGELLDSIPRDKRERMLIVVAADHGESFGEHNYYFDHGDFVWDNEIRVPLILSGPGLFPDASVITEPVELIDLAPTILEAAGIRIPRAFEGRSLLSAADRPLEAKPAVSEASKPWNVEVESEWQNRYKAKAVRTDEWKYMLIPFTGRKELYHLASDPGETRNVIRRHPEVADRMEEELTDWIRRRDPGFQIGDLTGQKEVREKLKALQYVK